VELQDINPPHDIRDAMEKQMRAERDKRAKILTAEAEKQSQILNSEGLKEAAINKAEGEKRSKILRAEGDAEARICVAQGEAEAISLITNAIQKGDPVNYLVAIRYIDTLKEMVSGKDNKMIYMPYEATGVLSSIGGIKDMLDMNKS
jgi:regulator of protease activity HflC (stomatin/prohibitin superfamily)